MTHISFAKGMCIFLVDDYHYISLTFISQNECAPFLPRIFITMWLMLLLQKRCTSNLLIIHITFQSSACCRRDVYRMKNAYSVQIWAIIPFLEKHGLTDTIQTDRKIQLMTIPLPPRLFVPQNNNMHPFEWANWILFKQVIWFDLIVLRGTRWL